ncbi:unnamed protein product [Gadus morhua 'NCC']
MPILFCPALLPEPPTYPPPSPPPPDPIKQRQQYTAMGVPDFWISSPHGAKIHQETNRPSFSLTFHSFLPSLLSLPPPPPRARDTAKATANVLNVIYFITNLCSNLYCK